MARRGFVRRARGLLLVGLGLGRLNVGRTTTLGRLNVGLTTTLGRLTGIFFFSLYISGISPFVSPSNSKIVTMV